MFFSECPNFNNKIQDPLGKFNQVWKKTPSDNRGSCRKYKQDDDIPEIFVIFKEEDSRDMSSIPENI